MNKKSLAIIAVAVLALTGCATSGGDGEGSAAEGATIAHAFGETVVPENPERVVTLGWGSTDAALALGVVPVGIELQTYGADADGVMPWVAEELDELGAETPALISTGDEPAYEEIIELEPDLILAVYSGITEEQYELLSDIAPTVAYPDQPWATPWRDVITTVGESLGQLDDAEAVLADADAAVAAEAEAHPEFAGKTIAAVVDSAGLFFVYKPADPRVEFLLDLGFENAPAVDELANGEETFYYTLSYEQLSELDSDILLSYSPNQEAADLFMSQPYASSIPAVAGGGVAHVVGESLVSAVSPPTALSLTWGLEDFVTQLAEAASVID